METQTPIEVEPPQQKKPEPSGLRVLVLVLGGIFGMAVGSYCGWLLVVPLALAFVVGAVMTKLSAGPAVFRNGTERGRFRINTHFIEVSTLDSLTGAPTYDHSPS